MMVFSGSSRRRLLPPTWSITGFFGDEWRLGDLCCRSSPHGRSTVPCTAGAADGRCSTLGGIVLPCGTSRQLLADLLTSGRLPPNDLQTGGKRLREWMFSLIRAWSHMLIALASLAAMSNYCLSRRFLTSCTCLSRARSLRLNL